MAADGTATGGIDQDAGPQPGDGRHDQDRRARRCLGLSVGCAQCHDHRYDPIPQADYYRLRAVFEPAYDWKNWRVPGRSGWFRCGPTPIGPRRPKSMPRWPRSRAERQAKQDAFDGEALEKELAKFPERTARPAARRPIRLRPTSARPSKRKLLDENPSVNESERRHAVSIQSRRRPRS